MAKTEPRGIHDKSVAKLIQTISDQYNCPRKALEELVNLALKPTEGNILSSMSINQIKEKVAMGWGKHSYKELKNDKDWKNYHKSSGLNGSLRKTWETYYREWVNLPRDEQNLPAGENVVNGIDIFQNFRPWEVFNLDRQTATTEDVRSAFRRLSMRFHPDTAKGNANPEALNKLIEMRDALLISF